MRFPHTVAPSLHFSMNLLLTLRTLNIQAFTCRNVLFDSFQLHFSKFCSLKGAIGCAFLSLIPSSAYLTASKIYCYSCNQNWLLWMNKAVFIGRQSVRTCYTGQTKCVDWPSNYSQLVNIVLKAFKVVLSAIVRCLSAR